MGDGGTKFRVPSSEFRVGRGWGDGGIRVPSSEFRVPSGKRMGRWGGGGMGGWGDGKKFLLKCCVLYPINAQIIKGVLRMTKTQNNIPRGRGGMVDATDLEN
uniref:Uncharacterized protein n=1 Tax=Desertifilum tharense IPPAS B-1220 TaxID=1781255 RepID=A0A1E5QHC3_9CYAN|nr:hypothetical protein BH720_16470 [Desertifilum tharense IPPAS B-1220]